MNWFTDGAAVVSTVLALYCSIPYWRSILQGRTHPHQFSWLIFMIMNATVTLSQFLEGARLSLLISLLFTIESVVNFGLSFRYGTRDTSRWDRLLFGLSIFTIVVWVLTKNNAMAIWLTVVIDVLATAMTVLKIRADPSSEASGPWAIAMLAFVFTCISLAGTPFGILYVRPLYGVASSGVVVLAVFVYRRVYPNSMRVRTARAHAVVES